jgi:hypothetical protein
MLCWMCLTSVLLGDSKSFFNAAGHHTLFALMRVLVSFVMFAKELQGAYHRRMGRIRASFIFLDLASEQVACSSGVLLSDANIRRLAGRYHVNELRGMTRIVHRDMVFRAEEFEDAILRLRVAIRELPDNRMGQFLLIDVCKTIWASGGNAQKIAKAYLAVADSGKYKSMTGEALEEIATISGQQMRHIVQFATGWSEVGRRTHLLNERRQHKRWDGVVQLDRLFEGEHIPDDPQFI